MRSGAQELAPLSQRVRFCCADLEDRDLAEQAACSLASLLESCSSQQQCKLVTSLLLSGVPCFCADQWPCSFERCQGHSRG